MRDKIIKKLAKDCEISIPEQRHEPTVKTSCPKKIGYIITWQGKLGFSVPWKFYKSEKKAEREAKRLNSFYCTWRSTSHFRSYKEILVSFYQHRDFFPPATALPDYLNEAEVFIDFGATAKYSIVEIYE